MKKYFRNVFLAIGITALGVYLIFTISSIEDRLKNDNQILCVFDSEYSADPDDRIMEIYTWANEMDKSGTEVRRLAELTPGTPVYTGTLYGKCELVELYGEYSDESYEGIYGYSSVENDYKFSDPIITIEYDGRIECRYSVDLGEGWLYYGKTKNYMLDGENTNRDASGIGNQSLTIRPNVCGIRELKNSLNYCSEDMREYNEYREVNLLDVCPELPLRLDHCIGDEVITHILVTAYDPADTEKINASADIEITYFRGGKLDYNKLLTDGYSDLPKVRDLHPFMKVKVVRYEQIEIVE